MIEMDYRDIGRHIRRWRRVMWFLGLLKTLFPLFEFVLMSNLCLRGAPAADAQAENYQWLAHSKWSSL